MEGEKDKAIGSNQNRGVENNVAGVNYGNQITIFQPATVPEERDRLEQLLLKAVGSEVESRLNQSLHNRIYIELDKEQDPKQVRTPWDMELKTGKGDREQLPKGTKIESIFDRSDINGQLLILGAPGSGKTTTLLELAKVLVARARENSSFPVPVLLNLSSWKEDKQSIAAWMVEALKPKYGVRIDIGRGFVEDVRILPLLDGLDELASDRQESCVNRINEFLEQWPSDLLVCSRTEEYQHYALQLGLRGSVVLHPLRLEQIRDYVVQSQGESLWQLLAAEPDLLELGKIPLMLNIMVVARGKLDFQHWQKLASSAERLNYLFDAYIDTMLGRPASKPPVPNLTLRWLGWLATKLIQENQTEFLIERIQPYWLNQNAQRLIYALIVGLIVGLIGGSIGVIILGLIAFLIAGLISVPIAGMIVGLTAWVVSGLLYGLDLALKELNLVLNQEPIQKCKTKTADTLQWNFNDRKKSLIENLIIGLRLGSIAGLSLGVSLALTAAIVAGTIAGPIARLSLKRILILLILVLSLGLIVGLIIGLFQGLILGLTVWHIEKISTTKTPEALQSNFDNRYKKSFVKRLILDLTFELNRGSVSFFKEVLQIKTTEALQWNFNKCKKLPILFWPIVMMLAGIIIPAIVSKQINYPIQGAILWFIVGLIHWLTQGFSSPEVANKTIPNQGIRQTLINSRFLSILSYLPIVLLLSIFFQIQGDNFEWFLPFIAGLVLALIFGISLCRAFIQHFALRLVLWWNGYAPWNYAKFLDYATDRLLMQRVGGGYRFLHRLLQEHFAKRYEAR